MKPIASYLSAVLTDTEKETTMKQRQQDWAQQIENNQRAGTPKAVMALMVLLSDGGPCPQCGKDWKPIYWDNAYGKGFYYEPDCHCYPYCQRCTWKGPSGLHKHWLYMEDAAGSIIGNKCPECGAKIVH